jgi:hypothetical protein
MEAAAQDGSSAGDGVDEIERGGGVEDESEGIGPVPAGSSAEAAQAFSALE